MNKKAITTSAIVTLVIILLLAIVIINFLMGGYFYQLYSKIPCALEQTKGRDFPELHAALDACYAQNLKAQKGNCDKIEITPICDLKEPETQPESQLYTVVLDNPKTSQGCFEPSFVNTNNKFVITLKNC